MAAKFSTSLNRIVRDINRASRDATRQRQQQIRADLQNARVYERAQAAETKEQKRLYVESRIADVASQNESLEQSVSELNELLAQGLKNEPAIDFEKLLLTSGHLQRTLGDLHNALPAPSRNIPAKPSALMRQGSHSSETI